jgi:hypothetical protein
MKISARTVKRLGEIITGDKGISPYRGVPKLVSNDLISPQWRRDFAKLGSKLGFPKILSSIVDGMIAAPGF